MINRKQVTNLIGMIQELSMSKSYQLIDLMLARLNIHKLTQDAMLDFLVVTKSVEHNLKKRTEFIENCERELQNRSEKKSKAFESNK